jgi:hypothetical protein
MVLSDEYFRESIVRYLSFGISTYEIIFRTFPPLIGYGKEHPIKGY